MKDNIRKNRIKGMTPRVHGHTKIVFIDRSGRETVKFDKDNLVTDALQKIFESNYFGAIDYSLLMPAIKKVVGGVVLFENTLGNDGSDIWIPNSFDNKIIGHAGQTIPTSLADDITRGIPNSVSSVGLSNGYKLVWNFPETQGNGDISAVGLCHSDFGDLALKNSDFKPLEMISNNSIKSVTFAKDDERYKIVNVHDNVNGYSYTIVTDDVNVGRDGQIINNNYVTFTVKRRKNQLLNNISVDMGHFLGNEENEETFELIWSEDNTGALSNLPLPSIYIDNTNNLFWITSSYGYAVNGGYRSFSAKAYDMTQFAEGASLNPVKTQSISNAVAFGSNMPLQGIIKEGADGYIPAVFIEQAGSRFGLVSYDATAKEFVRENITGVQLTSQTVNERYSELMALGNYYFVRGDIGGEFVKLLEVDRTNDQIKSYDVASDVLTISPFYIESDNPIIGATQWGYSPVRFTMGNSGAALNKLYLATKNDLPATITKTPANAMRVEYTLTYV